jgi:hypothetical protein
MIFDVSDFGFFQMDKSFGGAVSHGAQEKKGTRMPFGTKAMQAQHKTRR